MSYFQRPDGGFDQSPATTEDSPRSPFAEGGGAVRQLDQRRRPNGRRAAQVSEESDRDPMRQLLRSGLDQR